jgi:hypothetical protein
MNTVEYALRCANGGIVTLVPYPNFPNVSIPDLSIPDTIQQYDIGTKFEYNGKVYFYAKAAGTVVPNMGAKVKNEQDTQQRAIQAIAAQYATSITVTTVSPDGPSYNGSFAKDYLKGGHVVVFPAVGMTYTFCRGIVGNDVLAAAGTLKLYLDAPIPVALTTSGAAEINASPWAAVVPNTATHVTDNLTACCGVPTLRTTTGTWLWVQTWGPCWVSPHSGVGAAASDLAAFFVGDGSLGQGHESTGISYTIGEIGQHAGWVMSEGHGGGQAAPFVYLQIAR